MNSKKLASLVLTLFVVTPLPGDFIESFTSYEELSRAARDIVIIRCTKEPDSDYMNTSGRFTDIEVLSVLKGSTRPGLSQMLARLLPKQGERYLVLGTYVADGRPFYDARPSWKIIPIDRFFKLEDLEGKTATEKIQLIIKLRLQELERLSSDLKDEKEHLEGTVKERSFYPAPSQPNKSPQPTAPSGRG